jgi:hypothetical protein
MVHSRRSHEGYLLNDQRASGGGVVEVPTLTCSHCHKQMIVNPLRTRERAYCPKCDHSICDGCGLARKLNGGDCVPMNAVIERLQTQAVLLIGKG